MNRLRTLFLLMLFWLAPLAACGSEAAEPATAPLSSSVGSQVAHKEYSGPRFSDWSAPINVGEPVNSTSVEQGPGISKDGLSLYFQSDRPGGLGGTDIWVSRRASAKDPWGEPRNLGAPINTVDNDAGPSLTTDGHRLYFVSNRPGGSGLQDIYVAHRRNKRDDLGWESPQNLGTGVNSDAGEGAPQHHEDESTGVVTLYFNSSRSGGAGGVDIWVATLQPDQTFGAATPVTELNSSGVDQGATLRRDGRELIFGSDRAGGSGLTDLYVSSRASTSHSWSAPVNLGSTVNGPTLDAGAELSFDGTSLYLHSPRATGVGPFFDLWVTTRTKLKGRH